MYLSQVLLTNRNLQIILCPMLISTLCFVGAYYLEGGIKFSGNNVLI